MFIKKPNLLILIFFQNIFLTCASNAYKYDYNPRYNTCQ